MDTGLRIYFINNSTVFDQNSYTDYKQVSIAITCQENRMI